MIMFGLVGLASTVVHAGLYLLLRAGLPAEVANLFALAATVVVNTEANRRWTFNRGAARRAVVHARAGLLFLLNFAVTTAAIVVVGAGVRWLEGLALVGASIAVTVIRFTLLDRWVFRR